MKNTLLTSDTHNFMRRSNIQEKVYEGMANAAAAMGISPEVLSAAKRAGCPNFRPGNRIHSGGLSKWITDHQNEMEAATSSGSLKDEKTREEIRKLRINNDKADKLLVPKAKVAESVRKIVPRAISLLEQKLTNEFPAAVAGLDVPQARVYGKRLFDDIVDSLKELSKEWPE